MRLIKTITSVVAIGLLGAGALHAEKPASNNFQVAMVVDKDSSAALGNKSNPWSQLNPKKLKLRSASVLVVNHEGTELYSKKADQLMPIASITKLMTALVVLESGAPLDELITIEKQDRDLLRLTGSRLKYGKARLKRSELLKLSLMSSENRAAAALGRTTYKGGIDAFVVAMNRKATELGMSHTQFVDSTGLDAGNQSTARDLVQLLKAAHATPRIRDITTTRKTTVHPYERRRGLNYVNTNRLLQSRHWDIGLTKTGYINEAGRCLVMQADIADRPLFIVLLNSYGKLTPFGDSNRLRKWIESEIAKG